MPFIQHSHLIAWSHAGGEVLFGELIRRLVYASACRHRPQVHFLSSQTNNQSGWDGTVEFQSTTGLHQSVWEISVRDNYEQKFREDYISALGKALPSGWEAENVIYVAATLRKKISATKKVSIAKDLVHKYGKRFGWILILDVDSFVQWIEKAPSVESWAADTLRLGNGRFGRSLEHEWRFWSEQTSPATSTRLVTAGRNLDPLRTVLLQNQPGVVEVQADSISEAVGLVYGALCASDDEQSVAMLASAIVVRDAASAESLSMQPVHPDSLPLTILYPTAGPQRFRLVNECHRVVVAYGHSNRNGSALTFERPSVEAFRSTLIEMNVDGKEAEMEARACGCSASVWHIRKVFESNRLNEVLPEWAQPNCADAVIPAVFLGGWDELSIPDGVLIQRLSTLSPVDFFSAIQRYCTCDDPLFEVVESERILIAPTAAFAFVASNITSRHLARLRDVCFHAFGTISPEVTSRWEGKESELRVRRRSEEWSSWILDGLAETVLRIAVLDGPLRQSGALAAYGGTGQAYVDQLVRDLPGLSNDPRVMASLSQRLPYLAEASPLSFMEALDSLLQGDLRDLQRWLGDTDGVLGQSFHTGVLWALELLAWSEAYLARASLLLARLAAADPGGRLANRPSNSLREIFLPWYQQTSASLKTRMMVLRQLLDHAPEVGWALLVELLPGVHQSSVPTQRPRWRDFGHSTAGSLSVADVREAYQSYISLTLSASKGQPQRLADLAKHYEKLSPNHRQTLECQLLEVVNVSGDAKTRIWSALHGLITRHKSFAGADWALAKTDIVRLEEIANQFVADDPVSRGRWLFDDQFPETGYPVADIEGWERDVLGKRIDAIEDAIRFGGVFALDRLIDSVAYPHTIGDTVAQLRLERADILAIVAHWVSLNTKRSLATAQAASATRFKLEGDIWTQDVLRRARSANWGPKQVAALLLGYPDSIRLYELVQELGSPVESAYWSERYAFIRMDGGDVKTLSMAAERLVVYHRVAELIDMNWPRLKMLGYEKVLSLVDALLDQLAEGTAPRGLGTLSYDLQNLFSWLRHQASASASELARREYALLPLLTSLGRPANEEEPLSLHYLMQKDPQFYVDVLCDLYRPAIKRDSDMSDTDESQRRARAAYDLLQTFTLIPGVTGGQLESERELNEWVDGVRSIAADRDREGIVDQYIGKLIFHVPLSSDEQTWPNPAVRRIIERLSSSEIEKGISLEAFNSIGVTSRGMHDGGRLERDREDWYLRQATAMGSNWPRTYRLCLAIAETWRRQAEHQDNEVKKRQSAGRR